MTPVNNPPITLIDLINRISAEGVQMNANIKRQLTAVRNALDLPSFESALEFAATLTIQLIPMLDQWGDLTIQSPLSLSHLKIKVLEPSTTANQ